MASTRSGRKTNKTANTKLGYYLFRMRSDVTANHLSFGDYLGVIVHFLWTYLQHFTRNAYIEMLPDGKPASPPSLRATHTRTCMSQSLSFPRFTRSPPCPWLSLTLSSLCRKPPSHCSHHPPTLLPIFSWLYTFSQHLRCYVFVCLPDYSSTRI